MKRFSYYLGWIGLLFSLTLIVSCGDDDDNNMTNTPSGAWSSGQAMPTARKEISNSVVTLNNLIYVVSGVAQSGQTVGTLEVYDPNADNWQRLEDLPQAVWRSSAAVYNGRLYVFGGYTGTSFPFNPVRSAYSYDPASDTWSALADMPSARGACAAETLGDNIYILGGASDQALNSVLVYDPENDNWTTGPSMSARRSGVSATVLDNKIYAFGGYELGNSGVVSKSSAEVFDGSNWSSIASMPLADLGQTASVLENKIYLFGGTNNAVEYDPATDDWSDLTDMPTPVSFGGSATIGNAIHVIGGGPTNLNRVDGVNQNRIFTLSQ